MRGWEETYDAAVIGAGHAGCEAALALARLGLSTILFTVSVDSIAMMPCNPNIGGSSKGHLVRELDALGGEMGKNIDKTFLQSKMLNRSKGPAVHSLRAQADKQAYSASMRKTLENTDNLVIRQAEVSEVVVEEVGGKPHITAVRTVSGATFHVKGCVLASGTYLAARCIFGDVSMPTGPNGLMAATHLSDSLRKAGVRLQRFKTGTPARIDGRTVDFSKMEIQEGDVPVTPFSFSTDPEDVQKDQVPCWLTWTNEETHRILRENLDRSPLFSGVIEGVGPRYCPSIEDKVVRFPDKERHQIFVEPEGLYTHELYLSGLSSSMPDDVQQRVVRSIAGLENARIVRNAYAIEYDCLAPGQLKSTLELRAIGGFYCAGQFNGSSGYEEAAAQGIVAGINCAKHIEGKAELVLSRSSSYIGVLIDDLVTKEHTEPYRMMTSRAEYRLLLRQDNADLRLREVGYAMGLVSEEEIAKTREKKKLIDAEEERLKTAVAAPSEELQAYLRAQGSHELKSGVFLDELIRRPELSYEGLAPFDPDRPLLPADVCEQVEIQIKYGGYIKRQMEQVERMNRLEGKQIPEDLDYTLVPSLRREAREKLIRFRPANIGQAGRISGVSPADVSVLLVWLEQHYRQTAAEGNDEP